VTARPSIPRSALISAARITPPHFATSARWAKLETPMQDVWAVAIDPADPDVLIRGTRPARFWRSADAGRSWAELHAPGRA